jgi:hypothetical protein
VPSSGRSSAGLIAGSALGYQWNFYLFAMFALLGAVLIASVPPARVAAEAPDRTAPQGRQP